jgi:hypothetical protein
MSEDVPATADPVPCFTLVFEGEVPANTDTPFGKPVAVVAGDGLMEWAERGDRIAALVAENDRLKSALGVAHDRINAIGGYADKDDDFGHGMNRAVEHALEIIDDLIEGKP